MAHPKHRTSPTNTKRSLEFAGNLIDLIGRGFSGNTISNQSYRNLDNIAVNRNDNLYVVHPDITDREVPNLIINPSRNPNYGLFTTGIGYNMHGELVDYKNNRSITEKEAKQKAKEYANNSKANRTKIALNNLAKSNTFKDGGSIHIDPSKRGTFTAAASKHGMGVQEFASRVLRNKENYSPSLVRKANFAKEANKWNH